MCFQTHVTDRNSKNISFIFTCDASDLPLQVRAYKSGQVSSQTDADQVD